ncbi:MAG: SH3 domain-containing protein, partial [Candidatus Cloacimonetes bacterium]|nr:SH3 domain-containing protein [Candidatus Cloacimonadota bacterium]MCK9243065.1 SH3 domain-containing protein [Candidatus Cloacimonadota bacterium]
MYKISLYWLIALAFSFGLLIAQEPPRILPLQENPPLVPIEMRRPGFWISRHANPDSIMMDAAAIKAFNAQVRRKGGVSTLADKPLVTKGKNLRKLINECFSIIRANGKYDAQGNELDRSFWRKLEAQLNRSAIKPSNQARFGYPIRFCNQRLAPYADIISSRASNSEFDYLQNSGFDIGEPLIIKHISTDGNWYFASGRASSGWFWKEDIALMAWEDWLSYRQSVDFIVTTSDKSDLYLDAARRDFWGLIRMGCRLPLLSETADCYELLLPGEQTQSVFISKNDGHKGYLPFTARNIYELSLGVQDSPYGWGDLNAEYDCSGLVKQVYQCFGIFLPRNGAAQYISGTAKYEFDGHELPPQKEDILAQNAIPAA